MYRDSRWWYHYWQRKGHVRKRLESSFLQIDCGHLYDNREEPFEIGEENYAYGYKIILFEGYAWVESFYAKSDVRYRIPIVTTSCNYGGKRHWFLCPNLKCQRRVKILYLSNNYFICRKCLRLGYESQLVTKPMRYILKKEKIEDYLKEKGGDEFTRPRYMHKKTFDRLHQKYCDYDDKVMQYLMKYFPLFS